MPALAEAANGLPTLHDQFVAQGSDGSRIGQAIASVADILTRHLIERAIATQGPAPMGWAWMATGSQGRREMTPDSDQDNALILAHPPATPAQAAWFEALAHAVNDGLAACHLRYCPGEVMARTPAYRQSLIDWQRRFDDWFTHAGRKDAMLVANFADLRPIAGNPDLVESLRTHLLTHVRERELFLDRMRANLLDNAPPLGWFGRWRTEPAGEHAGTINLKTALILPIVDIARVAALSAAVRATGTLERLAAAAGSEHLSHSAAADLTAAFRVALDLRAMHQSARRAAGQRPDNHLVPERLSPLQQDHLRRSMRVVASVQSVIAGCLPDGIV